MSDEHKNFNADTGYNIPVVHKKEKKDIDTKSEYLKLVTLTILKGKGENEFAYKFEDGKNGETHSALVVWGLLVALRDVIEYTGDCAEIGDLVRECINTLDFEDME